MIATHTQLLSIAAVTATSLALIDHKQLFRTVVALLSITTLTFSSGLPVMASSNPTAFDLGNSLQIQEQKIFKFEEDIHLSNSGGQCSGLCVAQEQGESQGDTDILQAISSTVSDKNNLKIRVDNGAVSLLGSVKDVATAHTIIKQVESIPGVHSIMVSFALVNHARQAIG